VLSALTILLLREAVAAKMTLRGEPVLAVCEPELRFL
jgi:hypothetical protein